MSDVTIFKDSTAIASSAPRKSAMSQILKSSITTRRIQTNTNGTFRRLLNGDQMGDAVRGEIDVIIVGALSDISRVYYKEKYDPSKEATLPNCWSNLGDKPEEASSDPQSSTCISCPQNIKGSSDTGGRACRFQRRVALLLANDPSGDVYQFNIPAKSLFGKGSGNTHPFESYVKFLRANNEAADTVITTISYNLNADSMELLFTPVRSLSDEEYNLVVAAQEKPETKRYIELTVAQVDKVEKAPSMAEAAPSTAATTIEEPKARKKKKTTASKAEPTKELADIVEEWE